MQEAEQHQVDSGERGPSAGFKNFRSYQFGIRLEQHARGGAGAGYSGGQYGQHEHGGDDDLVRRYRDNIGKKNHPVQSEPQRDGIDGLNKIFREADAGDLHIRNEPDDQSGRKREKDRAPEHNRGAVDQRSINCLPEPRRAVGRQLKTERGRLTFEHSARQSPGYNKTQEYAEERDGNHSSGGNKTRKMGGEQRADEDGRDQDLRGPAAVAQGKIIRDDRDDPFPRAVDDSRGNHPGGVAAEAHAHRQRLPAVRTGPAE